MSDPERPRVEARLALAHALVRDDQTSVKQTLRGMELTHPSQVESLRSDHLIEPLMTMIPRPVIRASCAEPFVTALEETASILTRKKARILSAFDQILATLSFVGVRPLVIKGLYLAHRFYGGINRRAYGDLDLLVAPEQLRVTLRAARRAGYRRIRTDPHSVTLGRDALMLDVHFALRRAPAFRIRSNRIISDRQTYPMTHRHFDTMSDEDTVLFLALSLAQDLERGRCKTKHVLDLYVVLRALDAKLDWQRFADRRTEENTLSIWRNTLALTLDAFEAHDEMPRVAAWLGRQHAEIAHESRTEALELIDADKGRIANREWFYSIYPGSVLEYQAWTIMQYLPRNLLDLDPRWIRTAGRMGLAYLGAKRGAGLRRDASGRRAATPPRTETRSDRQTPPEPR